MASEIDAWLNNAQLREIENGPRVRFLRMSDKQSKEQQICINALTVIRTEENLLQLQSLVTQLPPPF